MKCIYFVSMMVILISKRLNADEFKTKKEKLIMEYLDTYQGLKDEILIESNNLFKKFYGVDKKDIPIYITKIIDELSLLAKTGLSPKESSALEEKIVNKFNKCFATEGVLPNVEKFEIDKLVLEKIDFADKVFRYYITCTKQNESYKDLEDCYIEGVDHVIRDLEAFRNKTTELAALDESEINKRLMIHTCKQAALKFVKNPSELHNQKKGDLSGRDDWFDKEEL